MATHDCPGKPRHVLVRVPRSEPRLDGAPSSGRTLRAGPTDRSRHYTGRTRQPGRGDNPPTTVADASPVAAGATDVRAAATTCGAELEATAALRFAEYAGRLVLEALDGKRLPATLASVLAVDPHSVVRSMCHGRLPIPGRDLGAARGLRMHTRPIEPGTVEVFGTYTRGPRRFAMAGRLDAGPPLGWLVTALQLG